MLKRKEKNNKSQLIKVGSFLILLGMGIISTNLIINFINIQNEKDLIKEYYENEEYIVDVPVLEEETPQEEPVEEKKEETKTEPIIEKKIETIKEEKVIQEDKSKDTNNSIKQPIEEQEIITNKEEDSKQDITNEEEIKEVEVEKVDLEYENLLKQVEYSTYDECMDIGFEKALEDTVNILGFSCPYIAYKGKVIGYKLQLNYTNPMEN